MALPVFASVSDLEARGLDVSDEQRTRAALAAIEDASNLIHHESENVWVNGAALAETTPPITLTICCRAAQRVLVNPHGVTAESETIAGYSTSHQFGNASTDVYLTAAERSEIRSAAGIRDDLWTLSTTRLDAADQLVDEYVTVVDGEPMPWVRRTPW